MTGAARQSPSPDDLGARVIKLEEHAGFASHEAEQLGQHVRALMARIEALTRRVDGLETRLRQAETGATDSAEAEA